MAVDYYELDLSQPEERFIAQELVHLAASEPGENCVNETLEGIDFETPASCVPFQLCLAQGMLALHLEHAPGYAWVCKIVLALCSHWSCMTCRWVMEVPRRGQYVTFYCREKATIETVTLAAQELHPNSFSPDVEQPAGTAWVQPAQCREIKRKMQECFPTAKAVSVPPSV
jgi:hypothetical protein